MRLATSSSSLLPNVTVDCHQLCERRANPGALPKTLVSFMFLNRRGQRGAPDVRQETHQAAIFAGIFTGD
jgi:hypothetical protein